jgi:hypothetical protein
MADTVHRKVSKKRGSVGEIDFKVTTVGNQALGRRHAGEARGDARAHGHDPGHPDRWIGALPDNRSCRAPSRTNDPFDGSLVTEARRIAPTLDPQQRTQIMLDHGLYDEGYLVVIAPALTFHVQDAAEAYQAQLQEPADGKVRFDAEGKRAFDPPQS